LTLAEADSELQRLSILKKNHDDGQYLARKNVKTLPQAIERLKGKLDGITRDMATLDAHAADAIAIGGRPCPRDQVTGVLGKVLDGLPQILHEPKRVPLGTYRGLAFGIILHAHTAPEIYLEGATTRHTALTGEHSGPRAVLNALDRLAASYPIQADGAGQELAIAEGQFRDYQARIGAPFPHDGYHQELTRLRDELRLALSAHAPAPAEGVPTVADIAGQIKQWRAAHTIEAAPQRLSSRTLVRAEEPVTSRIRRRAEASHAPPVAAPPQTEPEAITPPKNRLQIFDAALSGNVAAMPNPVSPDITDQSGGSIMATERTKRARKPRAADTPAGDHPDPTATGDVAAPDRANPEPPAVETPVPVSTNAPSPQTQEPAVATDAYGQAPPKRYAADPRPVITINLADYQGGPSAALLRSYKFKQMQIRFNGEQPDEKYRARLRQAGWKDRTESEGVWTKQVPTGMWQPVADAERLFKEIANGIRGDKGMPKVTLAMDATGA
jgi:hypothetical protein